MISREQVLNFLREKQESEGGYTGNDLTELANLLEVTPFGLRRRLANWIKTNKEFSQFIYLGKEKPSVTLFEFFKIEQELASNPIQVRKGIHKDIQEQRETQNQKPLSKPTFYRAAKQKMLLMYCSETYNWFKAKKIPFPENYSLEKNRESLQTVFIFSDLKTYGGSNIDAIYERLIKAKEWFSIYRVEAIRFYPGILSRSKFLKKLLSSIPPDQQLEAQAKLIFEIQASFIVECTDLLIDELIHRQGRIRQSDNASRQKVENHLRKKALDSFWKEFKDLNDSDKIDVKIIKNYSNVLVDEELLARITLLRQHQNEYQSILKHLNDFTMNMTCGAKFHRKEAQAAYKLATGEISWKDLSEQEKRSIARKPDFMSAIDYENTDIVPLLAISRLIEYIRNGKITFEESYYYQDIGERIKLVELDENNGYLTPEILDQLIAGTFQIDSFPIFDSTATDSEALDDEVPMTWVNLSDILKEVSTYVRNSNPAWFKEHDQLFRKQTDGYSGSNIQKRNLKSDFTIPLDFWVEISDIEIPRSFPV